MLDGYDEYTPRTNTELDAAIEKHLGKCFLILTSRPNEGKNFTGKIRNTMDGEVVIEGFSEQNRRINSRFSYVINMADFCSSLQWTSMGDIDIFAFISQ